MGEQKRGMGYYKGRLKNGSTQRLIFEKEGM